MAEAAVHPKGGSARRRIPLSERLAAGAMWLFALLVVGLFRIIDGTINLSISGYEHVAGILRTGRPVLVVIWHGKGLLPVFFFQGLPLLVYSSRPRDGSFRGLSRTVRALTLAALQHLGYRVFDAVHYPSEPRGVIRFLHLLERGRGGVIAADGPGGPMFRAKPGAVFMAKKTGVALLPVGAAMADKIALDSWDRFEIPRPFTRAALMIGEPLEVPPDLDDEGVSRLSSVLEKAMNDLMARAEAKAGGTGSEVAQTPEHAPG
ncbi:MAG: lysophospholipid acyltransferase family protein [bacterium]